MEIKSEINNIIKPLISKSKKVKTQRVVIVEDVNQKFFEKYSRKKEYLCCIKLFIGNKLIMLLKNVI